MTAQTWVALGAAMLAAVVSVTVPLVAFRMTLRIEHMKWLRERRSELYVALLADLAAETHLARAESRREPSDGETARAKEMLLPRRERAELGAQLNLYGSSRVRHMVNEWNQVLNQDTMLGRTLEQRQATWIQLEDMLKVFQDQIREEMGVVDVLPAPRRR